MATKRLQWCDVVDDASLMVLFNCALNQFPRSQLRAGVGKNVVEALSLDSMAWPAIGFVETDLRHN